MHILPNLKSPSFSSVGSYLSNSNASFGSGRCPIHSATPPVDRAGLSPEASSREQGAGNLAPLLSGLMSALGGGAPQDPLAQLQQEIQRLQQQMQQGAGQGSTSPEAMLQQLQQLMAQLAQMQGGQPGGGPSSGGFPATGGAASMGGAPSACPIGTPSPFSGGPSAAGTGSPGAPAASPANNSPMAGNSSTPLAGDGSKQYDALIQQAAQKYGLDPNLLKSVIKQESGFKADAKSPAGAMGLMQLMPGTAKELGVSNPMDPAQSIEGGAKYLAKQLKTFGGDVKKALAAYNAGPGNVKKYGGVPPFAETQKYVSNILSDYQNRTAQARSTVA